MSYARFSEDSNVYVFATIEKGAHVAECCGCLLIPRDNEGMATAPWPQYADPFAIIAHLREHQAAGHKVPDYAFRSIAEDTWIGAVKPAGEPTHHMGSDVG